jgi:hypothetical protein
MDDSVGEISGSVERSPLGSTGNVGTLLGAVDDDTPFSDGRRSSNSPKEVSESDQIFSELSSPTAPANLPPPPKIAKVRFVTNEDYSDPFAEGDREEASAPRRSVATIGGSSPTDPQEALKPSIKNVKFMQLLTLRESRREHMMNTHKLDEDDSKDLQLAAVRERRLTQATSFHNLPLSMQAIRKVGVSIDAALEEQDAVLRALEREERLAQLAEEEAKKRQESGCVAGPLSKRHKSLVGKNVAGSVSQTPAPEVLEVLEVLESMVKSQATHEAEQAGGRAHGGTAPAMTNARVKKRLLTHVDLALRHHIRTSTTQKTGTEAFTAAMADVSAPLLPPTELLISDTPIVFEIPTIDERASPTSGSGAPGPSAQKKASQGSMQQKRRSSATGTDAPQQRISAAGPSSNSSPKRHPALEPPQPLTTSEFNALVRDPARLPLTEVLSGLDDHAMIVDRALAHIREQLDRENKTYFQRISMLRRKEVSGCEPLPGVKTLFYFPSTADDATDSEVTQRKRLLEAVARQIEAGFFFSPLVWEQLMSCMRGAALFGTRRDFPTVFEFELVITPMQMFDNLSEIIGDLCDPLHIRKIAYFLFTRDTKELKHWPAVRRQLDAEHLGTSQIRLPNNTSKKKSAETNDDDDDGDGSDLEDGDFTQAAAAVKKRGVPAPKQRFGAAAGDYPYHAVDVRLETYMTRSEMEAHRRRSTMKFGLGEDSDVPPLEKPFVDPFSHWLRRPVNADVIRGRFRELFAVNLVDNLMKDVYFSLMPAAKGQLRHLHEFNKETGMIAPSETFVPPSITDDDLASAEAALVASSRSKKASAAEAAYAAALRRVLEGYQMGFHQHLVALTGLRPGRAATNVLQRSTAIMQSVGGGGAAESDSLLLGDGGTGGGFGGQSVPLPSTLLQVDDEQMYPPFAQVVGWPFPHRGGVALPGGFVEKPTVVKKKKGPSIRLNDGPTLKSVGGALRLPIGEIPAGFPVEVMTGGVGLMYEAFWETMRMSPAFATHFFGLVLSKFIHFPTVSDSAGSI